MVNDRNELLKAIAARPAVRFGISTADHYLAPLAGCFEGGTCAPGMGGVSRGEWEGAMKDAAQKFTFCEAGMNIDSKSVVDSTEPGMLIEFDCCVTSTRKDRDGDILVTSGMSLDPAAPFLWAHSPFHPLGKLIRRTGQTATKLTARCGIMDFGDSQGELATMARDCAVLIKGGCLRISHGFDPTEYEALDEKDGRYRILKAQILEISAVAIPSNVDAIITNWNSGKLHNPVIQKWAKSFHDSRPVQGRGIDFDPPKIITHEWPNNRFTVKETFGDFSKEVSAPSIDEAVSLLNKSQAPISETEPSPACGCTDKSHQSNGKAILERKAAEDLEKNDPIRWNRSLSKRFDVVAAELPPSSTRYDWASKYLETPIKNIFETHEEIPAARMGSWLSAFRKMTSGFEVVDIRNISGNSESPPVYETIQLKSNLSDTFLVDGTTFFSVPGTKLVNGRSPLIVSITPTWRGVLLSFYSRKEASSIITEVVTKTWTEARQNNFLKGEAFSLSGEFVARDNLNWSDVFLTEKNQKPLVRLVNNINAKGKSCPNRGIIKMGPPGTGKTLSGRVIKNLANATFIWISARDFYRSGAFGGFAYAFDLAKELSPCILFFEDIDNWIDKEAVDLMKTEMDGLTKSSGIITIMTTNFPEHLPEALIDRPGRFHDILKIDLPNEQVRKAMLQKWVPEITDKNTQTAVERTKGYSGAHIYELAQFAKAIVETDELPISDALTKALDKIDEQRDMISRNLLSGSRYAPRKDFAMTIQPAAVETKVEPSNTKSAATSPVTNTNETYDDNEGNRGQGPQQGDHDWHQRHMTDAIVSEVVPGLDTPTFDVGNTADDVIMQIATGNERRNPAPDTALADSPGTIGEPGIPTPSSGEPNPPPVDPSFSPGPQKAQVVNDAQGVQPLDSDSPAHHDTAGNIDSDVNVDVPHLRCMAAQVKHSGKEGAMYLQAGKGHVHHVMDADDTHPDNAHKYHTAAQIEKMYSCCRGVTGVKCTVALHPGKGMGYKQLHKGGSTEAVPGETAATSPALKNLLNLKGRLEHVFHDASVSAEVKQVIAGGYAKLMDLIAHTEALIKAATSSMNPNGGHQATIPASNGSNPGNMTYFSGVPAPNASNPGNVDHFSGTPSPNVQNQQAMQHGSTGTDSYGKGSATVAPQPRRINPNPLGNEVVGSPNIAGSEAFERNVLDEGDTMKWMEGMAGIEPTKSAEELELEALVLESELAGV